MRKSKTSTSSTSPNVSSTTPLTDATTAINSNQLATSVATILSSFSPLTLNPFLSMLTNSALLNSAHYTPPSFAPPSTSIASTSQNIRSSSPPIPEDILTVEDFCRRYKLEKQIVVRFKQLKFRSGDRLSEVSDDD